MSGTGPLGLDPELLAILACPDTHHSPLTVDEENERAPLHHLRPRLPGARRDPGAAARRGPAPVTVTALPGTLRPPT